MSDPLRAPDPDDRLTDGVPAGPVKGRTRSRVLLLVGVILVMGLGAGGAYVLAGDDEATASEVILEPATSDGEDPFFDSIASSTIDVRGGGLELASSVRSIGGDTPGLYGGTGEDVCDPAALVGFLEGNADKAAAFAKVLGITTGGIADYVAKLTPVVLREDTRVTNHGFSGGKATPRQSVLQAGTAVMVDDRGVPRVRCSCGNPLSEPAPVDGAAKLRGDAWAGFDEDRVLTVTPAGEALTELELVDLNTGQAYLVAVGTPPATTTTTAPPPDPVVLAPDGLGIVTFGQSSEQVRAILIEHYGPPTHIDACLDSDQPVDRLCIVNNSLGTHTMEWSGLTLFFSRERGLFLQYSRHSNDGQFDEATGVLQPVLEPRVSTPEGISVGSTEADLYAAYPNLLSYQCQSFRTYTTAPAMPGVDQVVVPEAGHLDGGYEFHLSGGLVTEIRQVGVRGSEDLFGKCR